MGNQSHSDKVVHFGPFEANLETGELRKNGVIVPLQGQPFQVLAILLSRAGKLVSREELRQKVWPGDTFVDFDHALNTAITKIRIALGDQADNPRLVETMPRRGYRFIAPVDNPNSVEALPPTVQDVAPKPGTAKKLTILGVGTVLLFLGAIGFLRFARNHAEPPLSPIEIVPLVGLPGMEFAPAFSPDGNQVAFSISGPENSGLYTTVVGGEKPLRITNHASDSNPRWSPDGRQIAFLRHSKEGAAIYLIPAFGGTEHRIYSGSSGFQSRSFDWSPDGKVLAITETHPDRTHTWIALLSLADSSTRRLTSPSDQEADQDPAFSPDGSSVAFVRATVVGAVSDIYRVPTRGGAPKRLTVDNAWIFNSPAWTPDGREIVFSSKRGGLVSLWRISASGGTPRPVVGTGENAFNVSISRKGNQLAYERMDFKNNICQLNLTDEKNKQGQPEVVISEKGFSMGRPHFSSDGKKIAFESDRFGYSEIWDCDSDGSNCGQLTSLHGQAGAASWSPDGRYIAFEYRPKEHSEVYLLEVGGGLPRLLTTLPGADNGGPRWSRDGKWIYFYSDRGGGPLQLWKIQLNGGPPVQITRNGGAVASESADGRFLYYAKTDVPGIWRMPLQGGEETLVLDQPYRAFAWWDWALAPNGIYFIDIESNPHATVSFFEFATNKIIPIWTLPRAPFVGLSISADGRSILYTQNEFRHSDIMLVKNFR